MKIQAQTLPNDIALLQQLLLEQQALLEDKDCKIAELTQLYHNLLEQFRLAQHKRFGRSSEANPAQGELFNEAETLIEEQVETPETPADTSSKPSNSKRQPKRKPLPKDLPRKQVIHDISDEDKQCECCGHELKQMGQDVSEKLVFIPATVQVIEHVRLKYSCQHCEKQGTHSNIKQAPVPHSPIPKGYATASLLSQIITSKYQYALPLYRQQVLFKQHGIDINRRTMADWMMKCSALFKPLYKRLQAFLLEQPAIQADETTLKVINDERHKSYIWVYCSGTDSPVAPRSEHDPIVRNLVLFDYQDGSRAGSCASGYLQGFNGYLQTDGYSAYQQVSTKHIGCWAHARRRFIDAQTVQGKQKTGKVNVALSYIQKLYGIEKAIAELPVTEKQQQRTQKAKPILTEFKAWLDKSSQQVSVKGKLGEAISYSLNQWDKLQGYLESGLLNIDNNRAERAIKPFVIGRKNWLFSVSHSGAESSAMLYSIVETAKANGLMPFDYINHCLAQLAAKPDDLDSLLPWNVKLSQS